MSLPIEAAKIAAERLLSGRPQNIIAQTDARHILQEVREHEDNYPRFDPRLTEKATHIAYVLISCGCSIVENGDSITNTTEGLSYLEKAGKILYDTYKYNPHEEDNKNYSLLIAGMALFAAKQYSRAFITLNDIDIDFSVGQIITSFIKKDFAALMKETNEVFFSPIPEEQDIRSLDEWIIAHEIARCFMIISDYIYSGNTAAFSAIDEILQKLLGVATEDRMIRMKQWKTYKKMHKEMRRLGYPIKEKMAVWKWKNSKVQIIHQLMPNKYFDDLGLVDITKYNVGLLPSFYKG